MALTLRSAAPQKEDDGFTLIELVVAMTLIAGSLVGVAYTMYGGMRAITSAKQRSSMLEIANAEMESLRALPYASVGVDPLDPNMASLYPGGEHDGAKMVSGTSDSPDGLVVVTTPPTAGAPVPYTVRRWITWADPNGGTEQRVKRLHVQVEYPENSGPSRRINLFSTLYPGGLGAAKPDNKPPVADFTVSPETGVTAGVTEVSFDGSMSTDPDGVLVTVKWDFGDGVTTGGNLQTKHTYAIASPDPYTVTLTVTDDAGETSTVSKQVVVASGANLAPTANFEVVASQLQVNVSACTTQCDPDGDATLQYQWEWGDGTTTPFATGGKSDGRAYTKAGTYTIRLTVRDPAGQTAAAERSVTVAGCGLVSGYFENPAGNAVRNDITTDKNGKPVSSSIDFYATTTADCTELSAALPTGNNKVVTFVLSSGPASGGVKAWKVAGAIPAGTQFVTNKSGQTGNFTMKGTSNTATNSSFTFDVHQ